MLAGIVGSHVTNNPFRPGQEGSWSLVASAPMGLVGCPLVGGLKRILDRGQNVDSAPGVLAFLDRLVRGSDLDELLQLQRSLAAHCNLNLLISRCQRKRWGK